MLLRPYVVLALGLAVFAPLADAKQIDNGLPGVQPMDMGGMILSQNMLRMNLERASETGSGGARSGRAGTTRRAAGAASPTYTPSKAVRKRVLTRFLTYVDKTYSPATAASLRKSFARDDFVQTWARATATDGLRPGNVADSLTAYWGINYAIAHGKATPTAGQVRTLRRVLASTVAANPNLRRMGDARKQEISEGLMLVSMLQATSNSTVRQANDPAVVARFRQNTVAGFKKTYGVDLTTLRLSASE